MLFKLITFCPSSSSEFLSSAQDRQPTSRHFCCCLRNVTHPSLQSCPTTILGYASGPSSPTTYFPSGHSDGLAWNIVSVLGLKSRYTVYMSLIPRDFPRAQPKGNPESSGTCFTVFPDLSPNTPIIPFLKKDLLSFWVLSTAASVLHKNGSTF